jgi:hypothetical protein
MVGFMQKDVTDTEWRNANVLGVEEINKTLTYFT